MITNVKKNSEKYTKKIDTNTITKLPFFKKLMEK